MHVFSKVFSASDSTLWKVGEFLLSALGVEKGMPVKAN